MDRPQDTPTQRLALIECLERDGRSARMRDVWRWPVTIGRAIDNDLVLDDPFVAPQHARLELAEDGSLRLQVLDTRNGVVLGPRRHAKGALVPVPAGGSLLQVGGITLRLRLPGENLAAEQPLLLSTGLRRWAPLGTATLVALLTVGEHWLELDPGADTSAWLPKLVAVAGLLAGWAGLWALMSKLFQHRFDFNGHLRVLLPWLLGMMVVDTVVPALGAALDWPGLWHLATPLQVLMGTMMVREHLLHVLPGHRRAVSAAVAAALLTGGAITLAATHRATDSFSHAPYMSTLPMPALRWSTPVPSATLVQGLAPLAGQLAQRVQKAQEEEAEKGTEDGE
ncbi:MAG: FHA domain-containing protein [Rubrivivax sp.]|nr:FHA domain-containing protein [Rubrivivax sp.]